MFIKVATFMQHKNYMTIILVIIKTSAIFPTEKKKSNAKENCID